MPGKLLKPNLSTLPEAQLKLWTELTQTPEDFVLYGGTAIALHLGHRSSIDFDFFSSQPFDPEILLKDIPYLNKARILQFQENTLTCTVDRGNKVQVSFFGGLDLNRVLDPLLTTDNKIKVASLLDLGGMKTAVIMKRATWKDYVDMAAILKAGISVEKAIGAGKAIYGDRFEPMLAVKALSYHEDIPVDKLDVIERRLFEDAIKHINDAVTQINLNRIPKLVSKKYIFSANQLSR